MGLQDDVRNLASNPTLQELEPEALRLIAFSAETRILRAGDVLFRMGEASDGGYVVLSGAIAFEDGAAPALTVRPPALVGDLALIAETIRPCTALACEPSSVLKIPRALFHRVLSEFPVSAARVGRTFGGRVVALRDELEKLHRTLT